MNAQTLDPRVDHRPARGGDDALERLGAALADVDAHQHRQSELLIELANAIAGLEARTGAPAADPAAARLAERLERLESNVDRLLRDAARPAPGGPLRCVFLVHHASAWPALVGVHAAMRAAPDFEPVVVSLPHRFPMLERLGGEEEVHAMLEASGIPHLRVRDADASSALQVLRRLAPHAVFRQAPWDADLPECLASHRLGFTRLCYVPYGYLTARIEPHQFDQPFHRECWRIFCPDEAHRALFERHNAMGALHCRVTGYPKFDHLAGLGADSGRWPLADVAPSAWRLIWAPHFSVNGDWLRFGVFDRIAAQMLALASADPTLQIVMRPHPALREAIEAAPAGSELAAFVARWRALPNTALSVEPDYGPLFAASHALLTDGLSFFSEYQLFDRPLMFFERPDHIGFNAAGERLLDGMYRVADFGALLRCLQRLRAGLESQDVVAARRSIAAALRPFPGRAAERILDALRAGFGRREGGH